MEHVSAESLLSAPLFTTPQLEKEAALLPLLREVAAHHMQHCALYEKFCKKQHWAPEQMEHFTQLPFLPTSIFKDTLLLSIPEQEVFRELRSSATSTGRPSRMGLDKLNNRMQTLSLQKLLLNRLGNKRYDIMLMDSPAVLANSGVIPARASMAKSLLFTAAMVETCLKGEEEHLQLDMGALEAFLSKSHAAPMMLFGFTYLLYITVVKPLLAAGRTHSLPDLKILHIGGWKKLAAQKVAPQKLVDDCCLCFGTKPENVIDLYGFTEQGGLLYPTCEHGVRHLPLWSDIICRHPQTLAPVPIGTEGLLQFVTPIQTAYPGHSVLTEDVGVIHSYDSCPCGRKGAAFSVLGRAQNASEERGCGDILAEKVVF